MLQISLLAVLAAVLLLPVTLHIIEKHIEIFLLSMGIISVSFSHVFSGHSFWSTHLISETLKEPLLITAVVFITGLLVLLFKKFLAEHVLSTEKLLGRRAFTFLLITLLGLISSIITAIMAAILLVEIISILRYDRKFEIKLVVLGCFSIGLGAVLTPIGEPLSTICIAKLKGPPYNADFFFIFRHLGAFVLPGILSFGVIGAIISSSAKPNVRGLTEKRGESFRDVMIQTVKVYVFIAALLLLGTGFKPIIDTYIIKLPSSSLYWINILSAVMDNATLAAAEISPMMQLAKIKFVLMGLLAAGGMLIPGNIPNIIAAKRLGIRSKEWAAIGVPFGLVIMFLYFIILKTLL